jgi:outer membrane biogenesis lipoprotein LolB
LPASILQYGWTIEYRQFGVAGGLTLPLKVFAERGPQRIRLVVDEWAIEPAP